jgi:hypothetical protein
VGRGRDGRCRRDSSHLSARYNISLNATKLPFFGGDAGKLIMRVQRLGAAGAHRRLRWDGEPRLGHRNVHCAPQGGLNVLDDPNGRGEPVFGAWTRTRGMSREVSQAAGNKQGAGGDGHNNEAGAPS